MIICSIAKDSNKAVSDAWLEAIKEVYDGKEHKTSDGKLNQRKRKVLIDFRGSHYISGLRDEQGYLIL